MSVSALTSLPCKCCFAACFGAAVQVCMSVSRVLLIKLVKTLKSESVLSLFAGMWGFFIFWLFLFLPGALVLPCVVHRGTVDGLGESNCDLQTLMVRFSP